MDISISQMILFTLSGQFIIAFFCKSSFVNDAQHERQEADRTQCIAILPQFDVVCGLWPEGSAMLRYEPRDEQSLGSSFLNDT